MKVALVGSGKTGGEVVNVAKTMPDVTVTAFDIDNKPTVEKLSGHDCVICFLPGEPFLETIPVLLESGLPVITGATGFDWPEGKQAFSEKLQSLGLVWVHGHNFSLGMNLMREIIRILGKADTLYEDPAYAMHEIHHTRKKDAPSGTAIVWKEWLGQPVEITSERTGDVVGEHQLTLTTPYEEITVSHSARNRQIFASGALWTARQVCNDISEMKPGLYDAQQIALGKLWNSSNAPETPTT